MLPLTAINCAPRRPPSSRAIRPEDDQRGCLGHGGKKSKARQRSAKKDEREPSKERSDRRIGNKSPSQMARIFKRREFVSVKAVLVAGEDMDEHRCGAQVNQQGRVACPA